MTSQSPHPAVEVLARLREQLREIFTQATTGGDLRPAWERLSRWKERAVNTLRQHVSESEAERLAQKRLGSFSMVDPFSNLRREVELYDSTLAALAEEIERYPDDFASRLAPGAPPTVPPPGPAAPQTGRVFIVHGHDEANLFRLRDLLRDRFKLEPVILSYTPGQGRTIIEKFEGEASTCAFAFVLLTPDDQVSTSGGQYTQARPNVVFELGWFYGRIGRQRVVLLLKEGTGIHSDLDGITRVQFVRHVDERIPDIERELRAAGVVS